MRIINILSVTFLAISLAACQLLTTDDGGENIYVLSAIDPADSKTNKGILSIAKPLMASGLDTQRIALVHGDIKVDYYASAKWSDNLGVMVQDRLTESIHNAHIFSSTLSDKVSIAPQYFLITDIRRFQAEYDEKIDGDSDNPPTAHIRIDVKFVNATSRKIIRQFTASDKVKASDNKLAAVTRALDKAFRNVQQQIIDELR